MLKSWPDDWPKFRQACYGGLDDYCDMLVGPCSCGASHDDGEFILQGSHLYRYGKQVPSITPRELREARHQEQLRRRGDRGAILKAEISILKARLNALELEYRSLPPPLVPADYPKDGSTGYGDI